VTPDVRVALTGATGFAGSEVLAEFARRGFETTALVRSATTPLDGCRVIVGSLPDLGPFAAAVESADAIVHLASSRSSAQNDVYVDIDGSAELLSHWKRGTFVSVSSGVLQQGVQNGYALGKLCGEFALRLAAGAGQRGSAIGLRPGVFFGGGTRRNDRQTLGRVVAAARAGATFVFRSEKGLERSGSSFIGTADFARATCAALTLKQSGDFDVAGGFCTWRELIETVNRCAGTHARFAVRPEAPNAAGEVALSQSRCVLDTANFAAATGFAPQQSLEALVEDYLRAEGAVQVAP
jgi:nucleoside-diphosphate-sugar epimerase